VSRALLCVSMFALVSCGQADPTAPVSNLDPVRAQSTTATPDGVAVEPAPQSKTAAQGTSKVAQPKNTPIVEKKDPAKKVEPAPSPWQPPAEIDPVLPPVEDAVPQ